MSVHRLAELADFYGVPLNELLPEGDSGAAAARPSARLVIDLEQLTRLPERQAAPLQRYAATIQSQRGDYNGRVLSIRHEDLRSLSILYDNSPDALTEDLVDWGVLQAEPDQERAANG